MKTQAARAAGQPTNRDPDDNPLKEKAMDDYLQAALEQARHSQREGGFPVGSVIVHDALIIGRGRNRVAQSGDSINHAEIEAIRDATAKNDERGPLDSLHGATCYTTMMPCEMCAGAIIRFGIVKVVVAELASYVDAGTAPLMEKQGITVEVLDNSECIALVRAYFAEHPQQAELMQEKRRRLRL
jgi:creatinine deaminase